MSIEGEISVIKLGERTFPFGENGEKIRRLVARDTFESIGFYVEGIGKAEVTLQDYEESIIPDGREAILMFDEKNRKIVFQESSRLCALEVGILYDDPENVDQDLVCVLEILESVTLMALNETVGKDPVDVGGATFRKWKDVSSSRFPEKIDHIVNVPNDPKLLSQIVIHFFRSGSA